MKLEVGMYVRNKSFGIGKITKDYFDSNNKHWFNVQFNCYKDEDCQCGICEKTVGFKASSNIIDLIEVGDYVNGYKVVDFEFTYFNGTDRRKEPQKIYVKVENGKFEYENYIKKDDIKSIVTKEQFESMAYTVD